MNDESQTDEGYVSSGYDGDMDDKGDRINSARKIDLEEKFAHLKIENSDSKCEYRDKLKHLIASYCKDLSQLYK